MPSLEVSLHLKGGHTLPKVTKAWFDDTCFDFDPKEQGWWCLSLWHSKLANPGSQSIWFTASWSTGSSYSFVNFESDPYWFLPTFRVAWEFVVVRPWRTLCMFGGKTDIIGNCMQRENQCAENKRQPRPMNLNLKVKALSAPAKTLMMTTVRHLVWYCIVWNPKVTFFGNYLVSPLSVVLAWKPRASNASLASLLVFGRSLAWRQPQHGGRFLVVVVTRLSIERARRPNTPRRHGSTELTLDRTVNSRVLGIQKRVQSARNLDTLGEL